MPDLMLEVRDSSDVLISRTTRVQFIEIQRIADSMAKLLSAVPLADPLAGDLAVGRYVWAYIDGVNKAIGYIRLPVEEDIVGGFAKIDLFSRMDDLTGDSAERSNWTDGQLQVILGNAASPGSPAPPGLLYGTGWSTTFTEAGLATQTESTAFQGQDIMSAVKSVIDKAYSDVDHLPLHWYENEITRVIYVGCMGADSGVRLDWPPPALNPDGTAPSVVLLEAPKPKGTGQLENKLDVFGGSDAPGSRLKMPIHAELPVGHLYDTKTRLEKGATSTLVYIEDTDSETAYGTRLGRYIDNALNGAVLSDPDARYALYRAGVAQLLRRKDPHRAWAVKVAGAGCAALTVGQGVRLCYRILYEQELLSGEKLTRLLSYDGTVYITKIVRRASAEGDVYTLELGYSLDHKIGSTDAEQIGKAIAKAVKNAGNPEYSVVTEGIIVTSGWTLSGNAGSDPDSNFIGTTDNEDLVFRVNNVEQLRVLATGMVKAGSIYQNNNDNELALPPYSVIGGYAIEGYEVGVFPEGWIRFATGVDPIMWIDGGEKNDLYLRTDGALTLNSSTGTKAILTGSGTNALADHLILNQTSGDTPAAGFGSRMSWLLQSATVVDRAAGAIDVLWVVATDASRTSRMVLSAADKVGLREGIRIEGTGSQAKLGFYGVAAVVRPTAYTQTYATASRTHSNLTASSLTYSGGSYGYNSAANAQAVMTQINNLITDVANVKQVLNSVIDDLQANGLLQ